MIQTLAEKMLSYKSQDPEEFAKNLSNDINRLNIQSSSSKKNRNGAELILNHLSSRIDKSRQDSLSGQSAGGGTL